MGILWSCLAIPQAVASTLMSYPIILTCATWLLRLWGSVEVLFYFYLRYVVLPELNKLTTPVITTPSAYEQFHRTIDVIDEIKDVYPFEKFYAGWFGGCNTSDIYRDNVRELLAWALHAKTMENLSRQEMAGINNVLYWLKARFQIDTPEGYNPNARAMRLTIEEVSYVHRPLVYYAFLTTLQVVGHMALRMLGFTRHEVNGIAYWYRGRPKDLPAERARIPLIFFHGISPGLNIYVLMVHLLARDRKAVLLEVPHIAMCLNFKSKRVGDLVKTVEFISKRHRMPHFAVAGHSFGSLCAAWITKHRPQQVKQLILLDPVCVLLALPDVMYNFLYRLPRSFTEHIIYYGGSMEITIHQTLRRHFWWYEGIIFLEDIRCPVFFHLSGKDEIVPSAAIRAYIDKYCATHHAEEHDSHLAKHPIVEGNLAKRCDTKVEKQGCIKERIRYHYHDNWSHGQILFLPGRLIELDRALSEQEHLFKDWVLENEEGDAYEMTVGLSPKEVN